MAWRRIAAVTGIFIALSAPLASRPTFKSLLRGGADDATPATPTIRRRATAGGNSPALAKKQSVARDVRGFGARGGGGFGAPGARRDLIATDDNWLEDYCWSFDRRNQCNSDPCCEWDGDYRLRRKRVRPVRRGRPVPEDKRLLVAAPVYRSTVRVQTEPAAHAKARRGRGRGRGRASARGRGRRRRGRLRRRGRALQRRFGLLRGQLLRNY